MTQQHQPAALAHLSVLDLTGPGNQLCARALADLGADVVKVEPPGGDPARRLGPFLGGEPDPERSLPFIIFNRGKRSIVLNLAKEADRGYLRALAQRVDVLVEDYQPGHLASLGLGYEDLRALNPGLVFVSITPFGQRGPKAAYRGGELIAQATGGILYANGDDAQPPCMVPYQLLSQIASLHAAFGALVALRARRLTGLGQQVDVSRQEVVLYAEGAYIARYSMNDEITRREGRHFTFGAVNTFRCADGGYVNLAPFMDHHFARLARDVMRHPIMSDPLWSDTRVRRENREIIDAYVEEYCAAVQRDALVEAGQRAGVPAVPVLTPVEFVGHPHTRARGFFQTVEQPGGGPYRTAGAPARLSATPWRVDLPAPHMGQHTAEVLQELAQGRAPRAVPLGGPSPQALEGLRAADFTRAFAGPLATMFLGFFGAEAIKVESADLEENRNPGQAHFPELNRCKRSCTVDARTAQGKDVVKRLVASSDLVVENFRPGVMERLGLGYEELAVVKPDLIMLSMPGFGHSGPLKDYLSYGQQVLGMTGLSYLWGHPQSPLNARVKYAFPDYVAGIIGSLVLLAALEHRDETGQGQYIELAQVESQAHLLSLAYIEYTELGKPPEARGNWSDRAAPHDVYPCLGYDAWCAIEVTSEEEWAALVQALGSPAWAREERFQTLEGRVANKAEIDGHISLWTAQRTPHQVERVLQKAGVPAGILATAEDLYDDDHLRARGMIVSVQHPGYGMVEHGGVNVHLSATPGRADGPAPTKGQDNDYVFTKVLGMASEEHERLATGGALR